MTIEFKSYNLTPLGNGRDLAIQKFYQAIIEGHISFSSVNNCFCGSDDLEILSHVERYSIPISTAICKRCGAVFQKHKMTEGSLPYFYDQIYWQLIYGSDATGFYTKSDTSAQRIFGFLGGAIQKHNGSILEIGCGSGEKLLQLSRIMHQHGCDYQLSGCDYSKDAVRQAKNKGIDAHWGGVDSLDQSIQYDVLIISHVLEHISDVKSFLNKLKRFSHAETVIYIEVPGVSDLNNKVEYGYSYLDYCVCAHIYNFNATSLKTLMSMNGYQCVKSNEYVQSIFQISDTSEPYIDAENYSNTIDVLLKSEMRARKFNGNLIRQFVRKLRMSRAR